MTRAAAARHTITSKLKSLPVRAGRGVVETGGEACLFSNWVDRFSPGGLPRVALSCSPQLVSPCRALDGWRSH